jgi:hypothetical protein
VSTPPLASEQLPGCFRDPERVRICVRLFRRIGPETTAVTDDDGRVREVTWQDVRNLAAATEDLAAKDVRYPSRLDPDRLHQAAWLALAIFSPKWLEAGAMALNRGRRHPRPGDPIRDATAWLLSVLRQNLVEVESLAEFESDKKQRSFFSSLAYTIEPWVRERLEAEAAKAAKSADAASANPASAQPLTSEQLHAGLASTDFGRQYLAKAVAAESSEKGRVPSRRSAEPSS